MLWLKRSYCAAPEKTGRISSASGPEATACKGVVCVPAERGMDTVCVVQLIP